MDKKDGQRSRALFAGAAVLVGAALLLFIVVLARGGDLANATDDILPLLLSIGAALAIGGWWLERRSSKELREGRQEERDRLDAELERVRSERQRAASELDESRSRLERNSSELERIRSELERSRAESDEGRQEIERLREESRVQLQERDETLSRQRELVERVGRARRSEREWTRELREQIDRLQRERGLLGHRPEDVRELVLRTARTLLEAEKALMLSRSDGNGDGRLDLIRHEGFEHDPTDSAIAQRFAEEVLDRETILREDQPDEPSNGASPADREIKNLAAFPIYIRADFSGVVVCSNREGGFEEIEDDVLLALGDHAGAVLDNARLHDELRNGYLATVRMLADAIEAKDPFLRLHSDEVSSYVAAVAERLALDPRRREELVFASLLHDVGKIGISERILLKPGPLTQEERSVVELHPRIGCRLVEQVPALASMAEAILHHHERFDGDGYPSGIAGEQIPLEGRIICVADCFSAMTSERPYRSAMSAEEACAELERCAGTQFDPRVVRAFTEEVRRRPPEFDGDAVRPDPEIESLRGEGERVLGLGSLAVTDSLTLLYSHRRFHDAVAAAAERAVLQRRPFAVVLIELTALSRVNEAQGYAAGDALIIATARIVERAASRAEGEAFRHGGPRLGMLLPGVELEAARMLAAELTAELAAHEIDTRIGTACWAEGTSGEDILARARLELEAPEAEPAGDR